MYLNDYKPEVIKSEDEYIVDYGLGTCHYVYKKVGKRITQEVLQLTKCDMWKVITEINEKSPLKGGDLNNLNMEIRNHSLQQVEEFIQRMGHHQLHSSSTTI